MALSEKDLWKFALVSALRRKSHFEAPGILADNSRSDYPELEDTYRSLMMHIGKEEFERVSNLEAQLASFAEYSGIDTYEKYWVFDAIAVKLAELAHKETKKKNSSRAGRPSKPWESKYFEAREFFVHALRLQALLTVREQKPVKAMQLARAICRRLEKPQHPDTSWRSVEIDEADIASKPFKAMSDRIDKYRKVLKSHELTRRDMHRIFVRNRDIKLERQWCRDVHKWTPSQTELDECPEWKIERQKLWNGLVKRSK